jgi:hypothetical protein
MRALHIAARTTTPRTPTSSTVRAGLIGIAGLLLAAGGLSGCGPNCQSTCTTLYAESECNLQSPGLSREELLRTCESECESALTKSGEIRPEYKPDEDTPSDKSVELTSDKEAALWMDCVAETACDLLDEGYCAPVW